MKRRWGLQTEVGFHLGVLLAAALLFSGLVQLKVAEKELVRLRILHASTLLELLVSQWEPPSGDRVQPPGDLGFYRRLNRVDWGGRLQKLYVLDDVGNTEVLFGDNSGSIDLSVVRRARLTRQVQVDFRPSHRFLPLWPGPQGDLKITVPVSSKNGTICIFQMALAMDKAWPQPWYAVNMMVLFSCVFGLTLLFVGLGVLGKTVIRPVQVLQQATRRITENRLPEQLSTQGPQEIADMTMAFNDMTMALAREQARTRETIEQLQLSNASLETAQAEVVRSEKMASVGHLAAGMAHEIGNPLGATIGYLNLLKGNVLPEEEQELVQRSLEELSRIDHLVKDLLDYARPAELCDEILDPGEILLEACDLLQKQGALKGVHVERNLPDDLPKVRACRHKLLQVAVNLLLNARDALEGDGAIRLEGRASNSEVCLAVIDNGPGVAKEIIGHLFDPFFTTKGPGEGRGLGLAVCQRTMEEMGGRIEVESNSGEGACFELIFLIAGEESD